MMLSSHPLYKSWGYLHGRFYKDIKTDPGIEGMVSYMETLGN